MWLNHWMEYQYGVGDFCETPTLSSSSWRFPSPKAPEQTSMVVARFKVFGNPSCLRCVETGAKIPTKLVSLQQAWSFCGQLWTAGFSAKQCRKASCNVRQRKPRVRVRRYAQDVVCWNVLIGIRITLAYCLIGLSASFFAM